MTSTDLNAHADCLNEWGCRALRPPTNTESVLATRLQLNVVCCQYSCNSDNFVYFLFPTMPEILWSGKLAVEKGKPE